MRRIDPEIDGQIGDALVGAGDAVGLVLDLLHDLVEVGELLALAVQELFVPGVYFWTANLISGEVVGCAALKDLANGCCELKSMHVLRAARGKGVASALIREIEVCARDMNFRKILLETGSACAYAAARKLYSSFGFEPCAPFADYNDDPNSIFMRLALATG